MELKTGERNITNIRALGTLLAFEIVQGNDEYLNTVSVTFTRMAMEQGIYLRPLGNTVYIMPPYCITKEELQKTYASILNVLEQVKNHRLY